MVSPSAIGRKRGLWIFDDRLCLYDGTTLSTIPRRRFLGPKYAGRSREGVGALLLLYEDDDERYLPIPVEARPEWYAALKEWSQR